jgi:exodeoxyribonuclease V beta subunit
MKPFNHLTSPIEGVNLIEASAGTGKTYSITQLFIRLIIEKLLTVKEILVVTFTEAATEELKDRIRAQLKKAVKEIKDNPGNTLKYTGAVISDDVRKAALERLEISLHTFDDASIFTIHAFCRKILEENAFETSSLFNTELITNQTLVLAEVMDDFWRKLTDSISPLFRCYLDESKIDQDYLLYLLRPYFNNPFLKLFPSYQETDAKAHEENLLKLFSRLKLIWNREREDIRNILTSSGSLSKNQYSDRIVQKLFSEAEDYFNHPYPGLPLPERLEKLTQRKIDAGTKKSGTPPGHIFFKEMNILEHGIAILVEIYEQEIRNIINEAFHYLIRFSKERKDRDNIQFFDDLLLNVYTALKGPGRDGLVRAVRAKYKAALIDEFQDTDPVQFFIFKNLFSGQGCSLFLIGDPKQSIYSFRGADIFAYMAASRETGKKFTLGKNWRSEEGLISAINLLFSNNPNPFIFDEIDFLPSSPAEESSFPKILSAGRRLPCLHFLLLPPPENREKYLTKERARELSLRATASQIAGLLNNKKIMLGNRCLLPGDFAVLVRKNQQARQMQQVLQEYGIPGVLHSTGSLFSSLEARELYYILCALREPLSERKLKTALVTDLLGYNAHYLLKLEEDEKEWENWVVLFQKYSEMLESGGFSTFFSTMESFISEMHLKEHLMSYPDGERKVTNLLHLAEALHHVMQKNRFNLDGLINWLASVIGEELPEEDEHQLRLETDEMAVRIVTIHKSKGLQYPIVFCPFLWDTPPSNKEVLFHDEDNNVILDIGSEDVEKNRVLAEREQMAEQLRLLYVALTRARNQCYVIWGKINMAEDSGLAYLLHPASGQGEGIWSNMKLLGYEDIVNDLKKLEKGSQIKVTEVSYGNRYNPLREKTGNLGFKRRKRKLERIWQVTSFTSLTQNRSIFEQDEADYDFFPKGYFEKQGKQGNTIFDFPKGARAGQFMHSLFQDLDFSCQDIRDIQKLVLKKLSLYSFEDKWKEIIMEMVVNVLNTPLNNAGLKLSMLPEHSTIREMEFIFPFSFLHEEKLKNLFQPNYLEVSHLLEKLQLSPQYGFIKGFIDLIFNFEDRYYIVDWKSNYLGSEYSDYSQDKLRKVMAEEYYFLQYMLYAYSLHQYLKVHKKDYTLEKDFGGVYYIFLRGVKKANNQLTGVFFDKPDIQYMNSLEREIG